MAKGSGRDVHGRTPRLAAWVGIPLLGAAVVGIAAYFAASAYFFRAAEANIRDVLLAHRGFHQYIQQSMHPQFYRDRDEGRIPLDYYSPVLLSSSYVIRNVHGYFNEERKKAGLQPIYYKMAADNPRNPANLATPLESSLIRLFNERRELRQYRDTVTVDGRRYLLYAIPFLENTRACLRCHGRKGGRARRPPGPLFRRGGGQRAGGGHSRGRGHSRAPGPRDPDRRSRQCGPDGRASGDLRRRAEAEVREPNQELEHRVEQRTAELRATNEELDAFAHSVSHDLRAPLRAVAGFSRILEEESSGVLDDSGRNRLARVRKGCERMGRLIEELLRLARLTRPDLERRDVDLTALAQEVAAGAPDRDVTFRIQPGLTASTVPASSRGAASASQRSGGSSDGTGGRSGRSRSLARGPPSSSPSGHASRSATARASLG